MSGNEGDSYDMDSPNFNADMYLYKIATESRLREIMDNMDGIVATKAILESELQTLVYENYNKFISATDTIRKMKSDFRQMEDTLDSLETNMDSITSFSEQISSTLQRTRQKISRLSSVRALLGRLEFLFELPTNLGVLMNRGDYQRAVEDYVRARRVLEKYGSMPSFSGIRDDCETIAEELRSRLRLEFRKRDATTKSLAESVDLLLRLREPAESLRAEFLSYADNRLSEQLDLLAGACDNDILEFMDVASSGFLGDLCLVVASYENMFTKRTTALASSQRRGANDDNDDEDDDDDSREALARLDAFVLGNVNKYLDLVTKRIDRVADTALLVRALDRFHRRLQAINGLCTGTDFCERGTRVAIEAGRKQCRVHLDSLKQHLSESLAKVRQTLATRVGQQQQQQQQQDSGERGGSSCPNDGGLAELEALLVVPMIERMKGVLQDLSVFLQPELSFGRNRRFLRSFGLTQVREGLVVGFLHHLIETASGFSTGSDVAKFPPTLLLLLSKMCLEFKDSSVRYLLTTTDETFDVGEYTGNGEVTLTSESDMCEKFQRAASSLLDRYVRLQGLSVSRMLRKSVETRDWLHTIEPRTVRAVMKRVVEDVTAIESEVAALYDDVESQVDRSSDSSRKTHSVSASRHQHRSNWSSYTSSHLDSSLVTNIRKLFSERIEIFASVRFNKASILTGVIKISLKTFLECVRLRTFSKYGLQQIQVDTHYLQLYLWRFVTDENLVHFLLDEILGSAVHRCLEPLLMEPSVVDIICERG